ncbi:ADP-ribose pyrophosphatase YjhB, NUDIX family [Chitinophaga terrae (ex Kim and Jung 2007)]|uniref:ADP-ribose pyrophosphatase YjhB, NUDIX family n=1 Tax=Chitinophaga terrae (ex Kim and Jung 2007) TaxID=408074 RepID=A0A1H3YXH1_9BACT|nr:NUDIX hydrolase [Chitinophaga terrae (ex Kim and Jung 2007)]MDQ0107282.1 ADP-ribose pyrophosphatase YjhB (NUDIX family) [Chitinophaga terrae (ex Kim and Jung 2007)]SEA16156.1 ADP-ribose pyrophosphatase YjhB, NUDIX family [Chitinophaga terrae (ex Kim and Jung 2007)]
MTRYSGQSRMLVAVDCIIFGFDGEKLKLLLIKRGFEPQKNKWSLMGGFVQPGEGLEAAAARILHKLTGLEGVYMEQLFAFGEPERDPVERTISVTYFALIDINQYVQQLTDEYKAEWVDLDSLPDLIFDHMEMVNMAKEKLRYKAAIHPILFELLPSKFTIPQLQLLYEGVYDVTFDKRNFSRKVLSTGLLIKQKDKERLSSKRGAFYYKLDKRKYNAKFNAFLNFVTDPGNLR